MALTRVDGSTHLQPVLVHPQASDFILSPSAIMHEGSYHKWQQEGYRDDTPGRLSFHNEAGVRVIDLSLQKANGLHYCTVSRCVVERDTHAWRVARTVAPTDPARQLEAELWAARMAFCGEATLMELPNSATGVPKRFRSHPFRYIDHKEAARIR